MPLYEICDGNSLELSKCRRSDDILFNMCKFENIIQPADNKQYKLNQKLNDSRNHL